MDERLRYFKAVAEARGFNEAARRLHLSQPALSNAIAKLEKELAAPLIRRGGRTFDLTPAGHAVYEYAGEQTLRQGALRQRLARLQDRRPELRIGMIDSMADLFCDSTRLLDALERDHEVSLNVGATGRLTAMVQRHELDYALIVRPADPNALQLPAGIRFQPVGNEPLLDIVSVNTPPAERLIAYDKDSVTFGLVRAAFARAGRSFQPAMYSSSPETMLRLVRSAWGHAVLPFSLVCAELSRGEMQPLRIGDAGYTRRPVAIIYRRPHPTVPDMAAAMKRVLDEEIIGAAGAVKTLPDSPWTPIADGII